jgi:hypothetical protein
MVTKRDKRTMLLEKFSNCHEGDEEKIQNNNIISGFRFGGLNKESFPPKCFTASER